MKNITAEIIKMIIQRLYRDPNLSVFYNSKDTGECHIWIEKAFGGKSFQIGVDFDKEILNGD